MKPPVLRLAQRGAPPRDAEMRRYPVEIVAADIDETPQPGGGCGAIRKDIADCDSRAKPRQCAGLGPAARRSAARDSDSRD